MPCLWSRVKRLTSMASTNLQQLGCCNSHLSSSPKFLSGLLQFERQEPQKCLLSFLCWLVKGPKAVVEKFLVPSSLQVMSNFGREFAEIPKAQAKNIKKHSNSILPNNFPKEIIYTHEFPPKNPSKNPHINSQLTHRNRPNVSPTEQGPRQPASLPRWLHRANSHPGGVWSTHPDYFPLNPGWFIC